MNERIQEMHLEKGSQMETQQNKEGLISEKQNEVTEKPLDKMHKAELLEKINELKTLSEKNYDLYLRSQAEMENMKKRNKKEKEEWLKYANETIIKDLLPVMDSLEKAIAHSNNNDVLHALREGVELTLKGLKTALSKSGLEEIKAEGEPFDPCLHEAVFQIEDDKVEAGRVVREVQKGYLLSKRLVRPVMVVVSKGKQSGVSNAEYPEGACENQ